MRPFAKAVLQGQYDDTVMLLVPDIVLGPSFNYYVPETERTAHHIFVAGYPRWSDPFTIIQVPEIAGAFKSTEMLEGVERHIRELPGKDGWKRLTIVCELGGQTQSMTTKNIPRMARITALRNFMDRNFKKNLRRRIQWRD